MTRIAIIGAGMAGLACARMLADSGMEPVIFDKGRGIGGRLATRRVEGLQFDHGAQYVTARDVGFVAALQQLQAAGAAAIWNDGSHASHIVGVPGMSGLARAMAFGLDVRQLAEVVAVRTHADAVAVELSDVAHSFDRVVITVPAPQIAGLLGADHPLAGQVAEVALAPCLTLMAAIDAPASFIARTDKDDPLAWIAHDGSKPGRVPGTATTWVAQASPQFSQLYLEDDPATLTARMLPLLCDRLGVAAAKVTYATSHRWRYARVTAPLGQPFLRCGRLWVGGDWCLGPRVEAAWISGTAIARDILARLP